MVVRPSVLVTDRSACTLIGSLSVAELSAGFASVRNAGGVTVAVFISVPVAPTETVPVTVYVAVPLAKSVALVLMVLPEPDAAVHDDPAEALQVQVTVVTLAGTVSVTVPVTA